MYTDCHIALTLIGNIRAQMATQDTEALSCGAVWPDIWRKGRTGHNHSFKASTCWQEFWARRKLFPNPTSSPHFRVSLLSQADHYVEDACDCSKGTLGSPYSVYLRDLQWSISLFLLHKTFKGNWPAKSNVAELVDSLLNALVAAIGQKPVNAVVTIRPINYWLNPPKVGTYNIDLTEKRKTLSSGRSAVILQLLNDMDWLSLSSIMNDATEAYSREIQSEGYDSAFVSLSKTLYSLIKRRCHDIGMNCSTCPDAVKNGGECFTSYNHLPLEERTKLLTPVILSQFGQIYALIDELFNWWRTSGKINH